MKVLMINVVCGIRSTGRICTDMAAALESQGHQVKIAYGREKVPEPYQKYAVRIGTDLTIKLHGMRARLMDGMGFGSKGATRRFIQWVKAYNPDVIHLHNLHGYYINVEVLFDYLRTCGKKIIWTLHDCWSFTGHCVYFDYVDCDKWKTGCHHCPQKYEYPARIGPDRSERHYMLKRRLFTGIPDMTLVTPSWWLAELVRLSYMKEYKTEVIHNGVDTEIFRHVVSDAGKRCGCTGKKIILGVAGAWDRRKGLDTFVKLAGKLDASYQIILVGLTKEQIKKMPENITGIESTNNVQELAALYSAADVYVNLTLEDNYPTTNIEAIACGTPVITYDTGGSRESAEMYGKAVGRNLEELLTAIHEREAFIPKNIMVDYRETVKGYMELYEDCHLHKHSHTL